MNPNPVYSEVAEIVSKAMHLPDFIFNRLNIIVHAKARIPEYLNYEDRIHSYSEWNYMGKTSPDILAQLGFFCANESDTVQCFCCALKLPGWRRDLNPAEQHKHYRQRCLYLCFKENSHPPLEHLKTCVVCMDRKVHYAILPCGHICACHECLIRITKCPLCNSDITGLLKVFIPI